ncbi:MAG: ferrochelatase [Gemmatimonadota bacterium]
MSGARGSGYGAVLLVSFGGPEGPDDVMPFLANVLRGRNVPPQRMREVARHYDLFGGVSPINAQNRALVAALEEELRRRGPALPVYLGNRNWHPLLPDVLRRMRDDGVRRALAFFTSAYSSYSGCRQYRENLRDARANVGAGAPHVEKLRAYYNHPGFVEPNVESLRAALERVPETRRTGARVAFTAHSIPTAMARRCAYELQLQETARLVAGGAGIERWRLVYQSRSGPRSQPWLEPDVLDHCRALRAEGAEDLVVAPIGFVSDHMEVLYDLDTEARAVCEEVGLNLVRAATVGTHPAFVAMIRDLIVERLTPGVERPALGSRGPSHDVCPEGCCLPGSARSAAGPGAGAELARAAT